jgi:SagB-type dehydrogenase family enzyme
LRQEDPPFAEVQEARRSIREYGDPPITARQLGEFLYRVARVKEMFAMKVETPRGPVRVEYAKRPYPGGGALYELELYVVVNACTDLASGLYHYDPLTHRLETISGRTPEVEWLLRGATQATTIPTEELQILLIVAARFQRMAWKYSSIAYAAVLKHVGVLYQTMYLAATAMGLAPCGIGCGNSDVFCRAAGTDYYTESSVGEFLIGSNKDGAQST